MEFRRSLCLLGCFFAGCLLTLSTHLRVALQIEVDHQQVGFGLPDIVVSRQSGGNGSATLTPVAQDDTAAATAQEQVTDVVVTDEETPAEQQSQAAQPAARRTVDEVVNQLETTAATGDVTEQQAASEIDFAAKRLHEIVESDAQSKWQRFAAKKPGNVSAGQPAPIAEEAVKKISAVPNPSEKLVAIVTTTPEKSVADDSKAETATVVRSPNLRGTNEASPSSTTKSRPIKEIRVDPKKPIIKLMLLRAIGNALPPRHDPEQTFRNLNFTLEHEFEFPHLQKKWILNRLVDMRLQQRLVELLQSHSQDYAIIPFNLTAYDQVQYRFDYYEGTDVVHQLKYVKKEMKSPYQLDEAINQDKNLFITNQNAARNYMIDVGIADQATADWILPFDGNCFLHANAYQDLYLQLQALPDTQRYSIVPMNRAMTNEEVLEDLYMPKPIEEPQVVFHRTANGRFHSKLRYGRRNKVEFLQRLKVPGPWDKWSPYLKWETEHLGPFFEPLPDLNGTTQTTGWVTRLASGQQHLEVKGTIHERGQSRLASMILLLGQLDVNASIELHGYQPGQSIFYHEEALRRDRELYQKGDSRVKPLVDELLSVATKALTCGPWTVTDKPKESLAPSGDKHDYFHQAPYYHPQNNPRNKKWRRQDGVRYPGTTLHDAQSYKFDRTRLKDLHYNTTALGLAYYMTGDANYAKAAARNVKTWFIANETRMNPHMVYAQVKLGWNDNLGDAAGIIEMKDLYFMLDAVKLVSRDGFLTASENVQLKDWFTEYLDWLETSTIGVEEYCAKNNHGLYWDVQATAIASFINDTAKMIQYIERASSRMTGHIVAGKMRHELNRNTCEHYQMFTLQGWSSLARMALTVNRNPWKWHAATGSGSLLCKAAKNSIPFYSKRAVCERNTKDENVERWWPLLVDARHYCTLLEDNIWPDWFPKNASIPPSSAYEMPSLYDAHDGIAAFWNLGLLHANETFVNRMEKK